MKKSLIFILSTIILSSCGVFIQKQGLKNYKPSIDFIGNDLNKYQYDFEYLANLCEQTFPVIDSVFSREEREALRKQISERLGKPDTDNLIFLIQSRRYLAKFNNQHTNFYVDVKLKHHFPFVMHHAVGKWHLLNIDKGVDSTFIGQEVIAINGLPTAAVMNQLKSMVTAENDIAKINHVTFRQLYNKPDIMLELGIQPQADSIHLSFENGKTVVLNKQTAQQTNYYNIAGKPNPVSAYTNKTYSYQLEKDYAYLQFNACMDKVAMLEGIDSYVKPIIRPIARGYLKHQFGRKTPSKSLAGYYNPEYPVFKDFLDELFTKMQGNKTDKLVIDLRHNSGGDFKLALQLLYYLTEREDLRGFKEFIYTSDVYKSYFRQGYLDFEAKYIEQHQEKPSAYRLHLRGNKSGTHNLFEDIINPSSPYFIKPGRAVFKGKIFILANHNTGSAAALLTTLIQDNGLGTVIGTSVGNNPTGATTYTPFKLPKTKASVSIASTYRQRPDPSKGKVQLPDVWVEPSLLEFIQGQDALLDTAKALK